MALTSLCAGVGDSYDEQELKHIANEPADDFTFLVDNYASLDKIKEMLAIKTCTGSYPHVIHARTWRRGKNRRQPNRQ